jgi:hypothetical protein
MLSRYGRCGKRRPHIHRVSHASHSDRRCCFNQKRPQILRGRRKSNLPIKPSRCGLTTARSWHGPASVRRPSRLLHRNLDGVTPVADRDSVLRTSFAATAVPLGLRHVGPGRAA